MIHKGKSYLFTQFLKIMGGSISMHYLKKEYESFQKKENIKKELIAVLQHKYIFPTTHLSPKSRFRISLKARFNT